MGICFSLNKKLKDGIFCTKSNTHLIISEDEKLLHQLAQKNEQHTIWVLDNQYLEVAVIEQ